MVATLGCLLLLAFAEVAAAPAKQAEPLFERLSPVERAVVLMALLGLLIVGAALIGFVYLGGRRLRQIARKRHPPSLPRDDEWYRKPLVSNEPAPPPGEPE
jgi:hypothetical protein